MIRPNSKTVLVTVSLLTLFTVFAYLSQNAQLLQKLASTRPARTEELTTDAHLKCLLETTGNRVMYDVEKCISDIHHKNQVRLMDTILSLPTEKLHRYVGSGAHAYLANWKIFDLFKPTYECNSMDLLRIGGPSKVTDTGKWICTDKMNFGQDNKCVIFSLGSNNQFDFEQEMHRLFPSCAIHTFDCTGTWSDPSTTYHKLCIAGKEEVNQKGWQYKRLSTIKKELGVDTVSLLKMDIENYEWAFFIDLLKEPVESRPMQILVEFHGGMPMDNVPKPWELAPSLFEGWDQTWAIPMARMFKLFDQLGYRIAFQERNRHGQFATEIILLHERAL
ncbi:methyltransferase domain-containing protein [Phlyctochytrium arcticum]|nr:methyltransferase domain-containing protein [Phlyctochytrium arcticum]